MTTQSIPNHRVSSYEQRVTELFSQAGITINGDEDFDIHVSDERFYHRVLAQGSLGLGESFVEGWWDCKRLDIFFTKLVLGGLDHYEPMKIKSWFTSAEAKLFNFQLPEDSFDNSSFHYDIGNDVFRSMLDKRLTYTCGYWRDAFTLDEAQEAKLELTCRKLHLENGMSVLDVGCGWGSFAGYAAKKYLVNVTGITVSKDQLKLCEELYEGLPVDFELIDYRGIHGKYDRIVSLGMLEHVGVKNYRRYFETIGKCLKNNGIFLIQTIGSNNTALTTDPWINKYIFPNSHIPSLPQISTAYEGIFVLEDLHNFGPDYDTTLLAWYRNLMHNYEKLSVNYTDRFFRIWRYYLLTCAGLFRARKLHLWQMTFTKGKSGVYEAVR